MRPRCCQNSFNLAKCPPKPNLVSQKGSSFEQLTHAFGGKPSKLPQNELLRFRTELGGRFGYFYFSAWGRGRGSPRRREGVGGIGFLLKIPGGGVSSTGGAEGPGGCLRRIGEFLGGGAKYFFSGPKCPPREGGAK